MAVTDFDSRILDEEPKRPPPPVPADERDDRRRPGVRGAAAARRAPATNPTPRREPEVEPPLAGHAPPVGAVTPAARAMPADAEREPPGGTWAPQAGKAGEAAAPGPGDAERTEPGARAAAATGGGAHEPGDTADRRAAAERRRRLLTAAVTGLARAPEQVRLAALFTAYENAPRTEIVRAADAILTLYLRAETEIRRRLRPILAAALTRAGSGSPLALAVAAHLGAIALPRPARAGAPLTGAPVGGAPVTSTSATAGAGDRARERRRNDARQRREEGH